MERGRRSTPVMFRRKLTKKSVCEQSGTGSNSRSGVTRGAASANADFIEPSKYRVMCTNAG
jgi:hypothetical protein